MRDTNLAQNLPILLRFQQLVKGFLTNSEEHMFSASLCFQVTVKVSQRIDDQARVVGQVFSCLRRCLLLLVQFLDKSALVQLGDKAGIDEFLGLAVRISGLLKATIS